MGILGIAAVGAVGDGLGGEYSLFQILKHWIITHTFSQTIWRDPIIIFIEFIRSIFQQEVYHTGITSKISNSLP